MEQHFEVPFVPAAIQKATDLSLTTGYAAVFDTGHPIDRGKAVRRDDLQGAFAKRASTRRTRCSSSITAVRPDCVRADRSARFKNSLSEDKNGLFCAPACRDNMAGSEPIREAIHDGRDPWHVVPIRALRNNGRAGDIGSRTHREIDLFEFGPSRSLLRGDDDRDEFHPRRPRRIRFRISRVDLARDDATTRPSRIPVTSDETARGRFSRAPRLMLARRRPNVTRR